MTPTVCYRLDIFKVINIRFNNILILLFYDNINLFKSLIDFGFTDFISKRGDEIDGTIRNHTSEKMKKKPTVHKVLHRDSEDCATRTT